MLSPHFDAKYTIKTTSKGLAYAKCRNLEGGKMKKKVLAVSLGVAMAATILAGCSGDPDAGSSTTEAAETATEGASEDASAETTEDAAEAAAATGVTLEVETTWTGDNLTALQGIMDDFTAQTGIGIELVAPGDDYENVMKTRMASNDLPDLFETHGWSTTRYLEYLAPLSDQAWVADIDENIKKTVTADDGEIYVLPISIDPASICYNKDLFEAAGVSAGDIKTWDDFAKACEKLKDSGVVPVYVGGNSVNNIANLYEVIAPGYLTNEDVKDNQSDALLDGTFDWDTYWTPIAKMLAGWMNNGYLNEDILTASDDSAIQALANGEGAIVISGNHTITQAQAYNPDANLGILAIPTPDGSQKHYVSSGEGTCYGYWKDTEYPDECRQLLDYLATPEVCKAIATQYGKIPGLTTTDNKDAYVTNEFNEMQALWNNEINFIQYFDRQYLPSGMWNDMGVSGNEVFMDPTDAGIKNCVDTIHEAFIEKFNQ